MTYERLQALAQKAERLADEVRLKKGSFWGRILCEGCNKKRRLHKLMVCGRCGLIFCKKCCNLEIGRYEKCPNCGGSGPPIVDFAEDFEKIRRSRT